MKVLLSLIIAAATLASAAHAQRALPGQTMCFPGYYCYDIGSNPVFGRPCTNPGDFCLAVDGPIATEAPPTTTLAPAPTPIYGCYPGYYCCDFNGVRVTDRVCGSVAGDVCLPGMK